MNDRRLTQSINDQAKAEALASATAGLGFIQALNIVRSERYMAEANKRPRH